MSTTTYHFILELTQAITALLIVLNPLALVPVIASATGGLKPDAQKKLVGQVVLIGSGLLLLFTFGGSLILELFGVTLHDLRVAGGLLLLSIGFSFVFKGSVTSNVNNGESPSAAPLASPILVGPGAITTAVVLARTYGVPITAIAVAVASIATWIVFRGSSKVYAVIKETGADVLVRIMGILLAAIAVVYVRQGLVGLIQMSK